MVQANVVRHGHLTAFQALTAPPPPADDVSSPQPADSSEPADAAAPAGALSSPLFLCAEAFYACGLVALSKRMAALHDYIAVQAVIVTLALAMATLLVLRQP